MTLAEKLRENGVEKADFTKEEIMNWLEKRLTKFGNVTFIIGDHVSTNLDRETIGDCNPYNRKLLLRWLNEEGLSHERSFNSYGVEHLTIFV